MTIDTVVPTIDASGITAPVYADILTYLQAKYAQIFGSDVYLAPDSQDGEFIALLALSISDENSALVAAYRSFSPATASGDALSSNVKINGITRNQATFSTVDVMLGGTVGTTITAGSVRDTKNNLWDLPATVTIPGAGVITVTATARVAGATTADAGTVTQIATPTRGWQTVTNPTPAVPGAEVETDAQLRARQKTSVALPSQTVLEGITGAVLNVAGVTRARVLENDTGATDANGIPAWSTAAVVEGGDVTAIAQAIMLKKTLGSPTYGTIPVTIQDSFGNQKVINISRPTGVSITAVITLKALPGYTTATGTAAAQAVVDYINGLDLGGGIAKAVEWGDAIEAAKSAAGANTFSLTSLTLKRGANAPAQADVTLAFNEAASATLATVTVVAT